MQVFRIDDIRAATEAATATARSGGCCWGSGASRCGRCCQSGSWPVKLHTFPIFCGVTMRSILVLAAAAMFSLGAYAQGAQSEQDHAAHHPEGASAPAPTLKKAPAKAKAAKPRAAAPVASSASGAMGMGMGMGGDMKQMHDQMHKPGGMHDQMHGKDGQMTGGMPAASAASK